MPRPCCLSCIDQPPAPRTRRSSVPHDACVLAERASGAAGRLVACGGDSACASVQVIVMDNFFTGSHANLAHHMGKTNFELIRHDIVEPMLLEARQRRQLHAHALAALRLHYRACARHAPRHAVALRCLLAGALVWPAWGTQARSVTHA